jgi:hypothetical protein
VKTEYTLNAKNEFHIINVSVIISHLLIKEAFLPRVENEV